MRFIFLWAIVATEVVSLRKLGGNEVFNSNSSNFLSIQTAPQNTKQSDEVVSLRKLGGNEVFNSNSSNFLSIQTTPPNTKQSEMFRPCNDKTTRRSFPVTSAV
jgi:hypothetical protein